MNYTLSMEHLTKDTKINPLSQNELYEVIIIGGGPAALTAAVYCMRKGKKTGLIAKGFGGQVAETAAIENYMGYRYIEGLDLVEKFKTQVKQFEIGHKEGARAVKIGDGAIKEVFLEDGSHYKAQSLIITTGKSSRTLNVKGEKEFTGKGVVYCATCDAPFYTGKTVAVVGGGNSGVEAALDLSRIANHVYLYQHRDKLSADQVLIDKIESCSNVDVICSAQIKSIKGTETVHAIDVFDSVENKTYEVAVDGIFIQIGLIPNSDFVKDTLTLNTSGEIEIDYKCQTSVPGIFAAGDVTSVPYKQIIIAAGEGAKAALSACDYLLQLQSMS